MVAYHLVSRQASHSLCGKGEGIGKHPTPKDRYISIATATFAEQGFHGASLADLAKNAGVSKQALLHFFPRKEKLYIAVLNALAERLCAEIASVSGETAEDRLRRYFEAHVSASFENNDDARLVVRALLDAQETASIWPLRSYLDRLIALGRETERWRDAGDDQILASFYAVIGVAQYVAISDKTLRGLYGSEMTSRAQDKITSQARTFVDSLV